MKYSILLITFLICFKISAQKNDSEAIAYNVGLGSFFGGVGAIINKDKNQKWHKAFLKGLWQGALGGYVVYESKKRVYDFSRTKDYKYAWASKILYSAGNSIIENAASNKNFWAKWHITIGFNRIEFNTQKKFKIKYQLLPFSLFSAIQTSTKGKFDFKTSIKTGFLIFKTTNTNIFPEGFDGFTFRNSILLLDSGEKFFVVLPHEMIHTYQEEDFQFINTFFIKTKEKFLKNTFLKKIDKYIYFDGNTFLNGWLYNIERSGKCYYNNFFEQEANFYSLRLNCN